MNSRKWDLLMARKAGVKRTELTPEQVEAIKQEARSGVPVYKLADAHKISYKRAAQIAKSAAIGEQIQALREGHDVTGQHFETVDQPVGEEAR